MTDTPKHFAQIESALRVKSGTPDSAVAREFYVQLAEGIASPRSLFESRYSVRLEEALVWRILSYRMLRELGPQDIFQSRTKSAASGTSAMHPAIDGLAKTYERLRRIVDELSPETPKEDEGSATGLPMRMMKLLEETEGFLDEALELGPGEANPFRSGLPRRVARHDGEDIQPG